MFEILDKRLSHHVIENLNFRYNQWLSHQELHMAEWPHQQCNDKAGMEVEVLDAEGLQITVG